MLPAGRPPDLVLVEYAVNTEGGEDLAWLEALLRRLLASRAAVILVNARRQRLPHRPIPRFSPPPVSRIDSRCSFVHTHIIAAAACRLPQPGVTDCMKKQKICSSWGKELHRWGGRRGEKGVEALAQRYSVPLVSLFRAEALGTLPFVLPNLMADCAHPHQQGQLAPARLEGGGQRRLRRHGRP